jgi:saccharopine dehydrogenase (NADP+, L-glutamate forming)/spermidine synthase
VHKVLVLGAGLVTRPIVHYLLDRPEIRLTVATLYVEDAQALIGDRLEGRAAAVDVAKPEELEPLIRENDLVVSLVPYAFHVQVARCAIRHRKQMVTTSYVSPEMKSLDREARAAGVTILNEVGLDPGLDHMSAVRMIEQIRAAGGRVTAFESCTGGLPSPEAADNPWRYKFSWSPRGALLAGRLSAKYLDDGRVRLIPGEQLFGHYWPHEIEGLGTFEVYPNRDSLRYVKRYDLHDVETMLRGTIRYPGWCDTMKALADLKMLDVDEKIWPEGTTYGSFFSSFLPPSDAPLVERLAQRLGLPRDHDVVRRIEWTGLLSDDPLPRLDESPLDVLAELFQRRMAYKPGERDMVVMQHRLKTAFKDRPPELWTSTLIAYGEPGGDSATSRTVSLPAAVASRLVLEGRIDEPGVLTPTSSAIAAPILEELETMGIEFTETTAPLAGADASTRD